MEADDNSLIVNESFSLLKFSDIVEFDPSFSNTLIKKKIFNLLVPYQRR